MRLLFLAARADVIFSLSKKFSSYKINLLLPYYREYHKSLKSYFGLGWFLSFIPKTIAFKARHKLDELLSDIEAEYLLEVRTHNFIVKSTDLFTDSIEISYYKSAVNNTLSKTLALLFAGVIFASMSILSILALTGEPLALAILANIGINNGILGMMFAGISSFLALEIIQELFTAGAFMKKLLSLAKKLGPNTLNSTNKATLSEIMLQFPIIKWLNLAYWRWDIKKHHLKVSSKVAFFPTLDKFLKYFLNPFSWAYDGLNGLRALLLRLCEIGLKPNQPSPFYSRALKTLVILAVLLPLTLLKFLKPYGYLPYSAIKFLSVGLMARMYANCKQTWRDYKFWHAGVSSLEAAIETFNKELTAVQDPDNPLPTDSLSKPVARALEDVFNQKGDYEASMIAYKNLRTLERTPSDKNFKFDPNRSGEKSHI